MTLKSTGRENASISHKNIFILFQGLDLLFLEKALSDERTCQENYPKLKNNTENKTMSINITFNMKQQ
jgi:hypothetical protein